MKEEFWRGYYFGAFAGCFFVSAAWKWGHVSDPGWTPWVYLAAFVALWAFSVIVEARR